MRLCKVRWSDGAGVGVLDGDAVRVIDLPARAGLHTLADLLHAANPAGLARELATAATTVLPLASVTLLPPIDGQEVWAAGVTYKRSEEARKRESVGAAQFYDNVYTADRPELFFKATPARVQGPGQAVRVRRDSRWSVPEPELALIVSPDLRIVGYSVGNDMSARDIEGENPLYLPQAKVYDGSCALGPCVTLAEALPPADAVTIRLVIERGGKPAFESTTTASMMKRTPEDLVQWLGRDNSFPHGAVLFTGTGVVPPDEFTLASGDVVRIRIEGIGELVNPVA
jgi:2-dehydro-3-deoxy-D-arabinonate dehydratase